MLEHARSLGGTSSLALPLAVRPPFQEDSAIVARQHSPEEIIDTVFRVLCGYESVSEACLRKGIRPSEYYGWHENFVEICKEWSRQRFELRRGRSACYPPRAGLRPAVRPAHAPSRLGAGPPPFVDDEVLAAAGAYLAEDIARRAQDRLAVAWRADCRSPRLVRQ